MNGWCAPGATYVCPCGEETWEGWKSGMMCCDIGFRVTECYCDGYRCGKDEDASTAE